MLKEDKYRFEKRIIYLDYYEHNEKIGNGGFVKWEIRNGVCRIQLVIRGLYPTDTLGTCIELVTGEDYVQAVPFSLKYGMGEYIASWNAEDMAGLGISYNQCGGLRVKVSDHRYVLGKWEQKEELKKENAVIEAKVAAEPEIEEDRTAAIEKSDIVSQEHIEREVKIQEVKPFELSADKWERLHQEYPKITPFEDDREYLSITPRDFIVFTRKYQNLVHNSFMLHGYYNYGHLVLTKIKAREGEQYYLGVPGVYYEQEKEAASLFGFEGFDAANKEVTDGGFGYYMKRVEI